MKVNELNGTNIIIADAYTLGKVNASNVDISIWINTSGRRSTTEAEEYTIQETC